jgi:hypothetical protein
MLAALPFATEWASVVSLLEGVGGIAAILGLFYKFIECQSPGCHRLGLHPHEHFRLCSEHHPKIGAAEVTAEHIANATNPTRGGT